MSKRPAESNATPPVKKARVNPELEAMRNTLDSLLKTASDHHEEARIAAIDAASTLEEEWTDATTGKDKLSVEMVGLESEKNTADEYLKRYEESATVKMLKKAADDKAVETLVEQQDVRNLLQIDEGVAKGVASIPIDWQIQKVELAAKVIVTQQLLETLLRHLVGDVLDHQRCACVNTGCYACRVEREAVITCRLR